MCFVCLKIKGQMPCIVLLSTGDGKAFPSLDGLRSHINAIHLPKRFLCTDCDYKTNVGGHLLRHMKRKHDSNATSTGLKKWRHEQ